MFALSLTFQIYTMFKFLPSKRRFGSRNASSSITSIEAGLQRNNLHPTFRAIKRMQGGPNQESREANITKWDGSACSITKKTLDRWREYYSGMLNHVAATPCTDLDDEASTTTAATDIPSYAPTLDEVIKAIRRLKNGRAAGLDDITPELLKCAEASISEGLHQLFLKVWSSGRVPSEWRNGVIIPLYKGKGLAANAAAIAQSHCCRPSKLWRCDVVTLWLMYY